ncbi:hypothetical protein ACVWZV_002195 [Bradyrhizobium sp. GM5.1]
MAKHEPRCYRNPNRFCDHCENKGYTEEYEDNVGASYHVDCSYCAKFSSKTNQEIEEREREKMQALNVQGLDR